MNNFSRICVGQIEASDSKLILISIYGPLHVHLIPVPMAHVFDFLKSSDVDVEIF
jgi:hypothetical protein